MKNEEEQDIRYGLGIESGVEVWILALGRRAQLLARRKLKDAIRNAPTTAGVIVIRPGR